MEAQTPSDDGRHVCILYMISKLRFLVAFTILAGFTSLACAQPKPHVIMIYTDDMGYGDISSFSDALPVKTPNIDRLAHEGMKFTQFYVAMPICSPSRAAVLSSMFSPRTRLTNFLQQRSGNSNSDANDWMDPEQSYLPKTFKAAGYATAHVGKWHLGGGRDVRNAPSISEYGYDEFYSTWESPNPDASLGIRYAPWDTRTEPGQVPRHRRTEYMVDKCLDFLDRHTDHSCFVTIWPDDLHTPFWPSPSMLAKYGGDPNSNNAIENFYGVLEEYDRQIGRLLDELDARGLAENTIIFFTGDNGPNPNYDNHLRTDGLRGRKTTLYEGGIREPFLIRWTGTIPAGTENSDTILSAVDLLPTLAALAGIPMLPEAAAQTDGEDLSQAMLGTPVLRSEPLFWEYGRTGQVPRPGQATGDRSPILGIREGDFKFMCSPSNTNRQLYNVRTDPNETTNLVNQHPDIADAMAQKVLAWRSTLPGRNQPFPVFSSVDFDYLNITEVVSPAAMRHASGSSSTARINGIAVDPYWYGDIYAIHTDAENLHTFLRIDHGVHPLMRKLTDSTIIASEVNLPASSTWPLVAGFDYSAGGNRLFLARSNPSSPSGEVMLLRIDASTGKANQVVRTSALSGLTDFSVFPIGHLAATRGIDGNRTVGEITSYFGAWQQRLTENDLLNITPGANSVLPGPITANSFNGEVFLSSADDPGIYRISNMTDTPNISRLTASQLAGISFSDIASDQAGNMYGYDEANARIVIRRATDSSLYFLPLAQISSALGSNFSPTPYRGLAARMVKDKQADLFLASSTPEHGIIRIRFGQPITSVSDWALFEDQ